MGQRAQPRTIGVTMIEINETVFLDLPRVEEREIAATRLHGATADCASWVAAVGDQQQVRRDAGSLMLSRIAGKRARGSMPR
jgi:hypothetical protein